MTDHTKYFVLRTSKVKRAISTFCKACEFALELCKQLPQWDIPGGKHPKISVHRANPFIFMHRHRRTYRNGLLSIGREPLGDPSLPQGNEHSFLDCTG